MYVAHIHAKTCFRPQLNAGDDISKPVVHGTVNDLAICGAWSLYHSAPFVLKEDLTMDDLGRVVHSMQKFGVETKVLLVTGDTKGGESERG